MGRSQTGSALSVWPPTAALEPRVGSALAKLPGGGGLRRGQAPSSTLCQALTLCCVGAAGTATPRAATQLGQEGWHAPDKAHADPRRARRFGWKLRPRVPAPSQGYTTRASPGADKQLAGGWQRGTSM